MTPYTFPAWETILRVLALAVVGGLIFHLSADILHVDRGTASFFFFGGGVLGVLLWVVTDAGRRPT